MEKTECPVCKSKLIDASITDRQMKFYECPVCGRFELEWLDETKGFDLNHLASYLVYHSYKSKDYDEYRYHTVMKKDLCDRFRKEFFEGNNRRGLPVYMNPEIVESWYPQSFSERIDKILLYLGAQAKHIGEKITIPQAAQLGIFFVDRYDINERITRDDGKSFKERDFSDFMAETEYMLKYLEEVKLIECTGLAQKTMPIRLTPIAYNRIDELQRYNANGRNVLVAMKFGTETDKLREAIRKGIMEAGYYAIYIDEVQHNDFITPELLKHIRDSVFVVVDLTHKNNGAYFEEGYAMGLGKQVIQLCKKNVDLHFDIAQKNTIIWEKEEDIPERLSNRIRATIG